MARFKVEMVDGSTRHLDATRLVSDAQLRLERRNDDVWICVATWNPPEVVSVSRRHTELNGWWAWVRLYPGAHPLRESALPAWEQSW